MGTAGCLTLSVPASALPFPGDCSFLVLEKQIVALTFQVQANGQSDSGRYVYRMHNNMKMNWEWMHDVDYVIVYHDKPGF